jgi:hypothetical protein
MTLDAQAIERIIAAAEAGVGRKFPDIDRAALQRDLECARACFDDMTIVGNKTQGRELSRKVKLIRKSAQQIMDKMDDDACAWLDGNAGSIEPHNMWRENSENIRRAVQHLIKLIDYKPSPDAYACLLVWSGSTFDRIAGWYLREVFESHFKTPAGYREDGDEVRGSYIDFTEQALIELNILNNKGERYKRRSIADALTDTRKRKSKRKDLLAR